MTNEAPDDPDAGSKSSESPDRPAEQPPSPPAGPSGQSHGRAGQPGQSHGQPGQQPGPYGQYPHPYGAPPYAGGGQQYGQLQPYATGPVGQVRSTGKGIVLYLVTLGIYGLVWYYKTHDEMKRHSNQGLGGGVALLLGIFVTIVMPFFSSSEVGRLYSRRGQQPPVTGVTGCWILLPIAGGIVWFVKTNDALNNYWRSLGAPG